MKAVLISIQPQWCELIATGEKTLEVRKTAPKMETPFKCYIYCTKAPKGWFWFDSPNIRRDGVVVGEFVCESIRIITASDFIVLEDALNAINGSCLSPRQARSYAGWAPGTHILNCKEIYGWHISDLKIYEKPKELIDFRRPFPFNKDCSICDRGGTSFHPETCYGCEHFDGIEISRPPQSWCYVEEI